MKYGELPKVLVTHELNIDEMFFYQYLPIKFKEQIVPTYEERLKPFSSLINTICINYVRTYGLDSYMNSYAYLTAKTYFNYLIASLIDLDGIQMAL
jgi:hypothetical protein